jgi:hypothetical protein
MEVTGAERRCRSAVKASRNIFSYAWGVVVAWGHRRDHLISPDNRHGRRVVQFTSFGIWRFRLGVGEGACGGREANYGLYHGE